MSFRLIVDPMGKTTLVINGMEFSEETIKAALAAHAKFEDKPYIFQAGDVARMGRGKRIFFEDLEGKIRAITQSGKQMASTDDEQQWAEEMSYVKIGELSDYLPKDE